MKRITLKLTVEELRVLTSLASDQLFRKEFIDPKMPGFRPDSDGLKLGKALVGRLRLMTDERAVKSTTLTRATAPRMNGAGS
jgi:hypothetical protein